MILAVAASLSAATTAFASPVEGVWRTPVKNATIQVYDCGAAVCGRVLNSDDLRANPSLRDFRNKDAALKSRPIKDLTMMTNFTGGPKEWTGGTLYDPSSGSTYHGSITLMGDNTLSLKGCIFGPLCRSQTWTRVQ